MIKLLNINNLRRKLSDKIFQLGSTFGMDNLTIHIGIKYLEIVMHFVNFYQRNNRQQKLPSDPKPVKEVVAKTSVYFGKDTSPRIKALTSVKKELLMISWLLIAAKFNERDENLVKINELQKEWKNSFTFKNITSWESKILQELKWNLLIQTPLHYMKLFLYAGVVFESDQFCDEESKIMIKLSDNSENHKWKISEWIGKIYKHWEYLIDLSALDYLMLNYKEEIIALAWVLWSRKISQIEPIYSNVFNDLYWINFEDVKPAFERLWKFYQEFLNNHNPLEVEYISPSKIKEHKILLRNQRSGSETPISEVKKTMSLMPIKMKCGKTTFIEGVTPQNKTNLIGNLKEIILINSCMLANMLRSYTN